MGDRDTKVFSKLLRRFRLRAGYKTLSNFASSLADNGLVFDDSTLSRWENASRIPTVRKVLLIIIKILTKKGGISSLNEINSFLESAGQGYLTDVEIKQFLPKNILSQSPFQAPPDIVNFVGRKDILDKLRKKLTHGGNLLVSSIYGLGGVGKTVLAIKLAHLLRDHFPDGVLWSRLDTTGPMNILAKIAYTYGENINVIKDLGSRAEIVRSMLFSKKALLIFDNVRSSEELRPLLPNAPHCSIIVTSRLRNLEVLSDAEAIHLDIFTFQEAIDLFRRKFGEKWLHKNIKIIMELCELLGYLPLALNIVASQIARFPDWRIEDLLTNLRREKSRLDVLKLEDVSLRSSFNLSLQNLSTQQKKLFASLGVFSGTDFSLAAATYVMDLKTKITQNLLDDLIERSLIERSEKKRYRLHPLMQLFAKEQIGDEECYTRAINFYIEYFKGLGHREKIKNYSFLEREIDNILGLFKICYSKKKWSLIIEIWEYLVITLWDLGHWDEIIKLAPKVCKAADKTNNPRAKARCYLRDLGLLYFQQGNLDLCAKVVDKGFNIAETVNDALLIGYAKLRLGMIYLQRKNFKEAIKLLTIALNLFTSQNENARSGEALFYLGNAFYKLDKLEKAKVFFGQSHKIYKEIEHRKGQADSLSYLGEILLADKNYHEAKKSFLKSLKIDEEIGRKGQIWVYNMAALGVIEQAFGNIDRAQHLLQKSKERNKITNISWRLENFEYE